jgi:hypothetical protein
MKVFAGAALLLLTLPSVAVAQSPDDPELEACRQTGLVALKERSPSVKDILFDLDTFSVSKANTKVEDTPVRTIVMGEVYLEKKETGGARKFLCLVGEKGKVLLTFFTTR